jgi:sugar phosphate isomerase/epimerase
MTRIGIEALSVFSLPPVEYANLAADLGCHCIAAQLQSRTDIPLPYPAWSLKTDLALRREFKAVLRDRGIALHQGEGTCIRPGADIRAHERDLDLFAELGAERVATISMDPDLGRTYAQLALLAEMAEARGLKTATLEFAPTLAIATLAAALAAIRAVGKPHLKILIDSMHLYRSGSTAKDLAAVPADFIAFAQICDARLSPPPGADYVRQAQTERLVPGTGDIPLRDVIQALPEDITLGLEVPMMSAAMAGKGPRERLAPCVAALRGLLEQCSR